MTIEFPRIRVGDPACDGVISVFPLFDGFSAPVDYVLSDEALAAGTVEVEEVSVSGAVPNLRVENRGTVRVLFLEGEELIGAKQNRVLNTSVLIAAGARLTIPVSCVEQGRWAFRSRRMASSGYHSPSPLRHSLRQAVSESLRRGRGYASDQRAVWCDIAHRIAELGDTSPTDAISDSYASRQDRLSEMQARLPYVAGASGMAVAIGADLVAVDLFDRPGTCEKVWKRFLSGYLFDLVTSPPEEQACTRHDVQLRVATLRELSWERTDPLGEGEQYRARQGDTLEGAALTVDGRPVHWSVLLAKPTTPPRQRRRPQRDTTPEPAAVR